MFIRQIHLIDQIWYPKRGERSRQTWQPGFHRHCQWVLYLSTAVLDQCPLFAICLDFFGCALHSGYLFSGYGKTICPRPFFAHANKHILLLGCITFAYRSLINLFLANINPSVPLPDYLQMVNSHLKDESILFWLLINCFLYPLIQCGLDYYLTVHCPELKMLRFSCNCRTRDASLMTFIHAQTSSSLTQIDPLDMHADIVRLCRLIILSSATISHFGTYFTWKNRRRIESHWGLETGLRLLGCTG
jgi:hypothetical protein